MICKNCGTDNQDGISFCTGCGEPLGEALAPAEEKKTKKKTDFLNKKNLLILSAAAGVLVVLILLFALLFGNGAENAVEDLYDAVIKYDFDGIVEMLPPAVVSSIKDRLDLENSELEIVDSKELGATYIAEIDEAYQQTFGTNRGYIENAAIVYIEIQWKGEALTRDRISVYMVEAEGEWYFDALSTFEELDFE